MTEPNSPLKPPVRSRPSLRRPHEAEFEGPAWKHPYVIYIALTVLLFSFLVIMAKIAISNGWIPNRGVNGGD